MYSNIFIVYIYINFSDNNWNSFWYQRISSFVNVFITPDKDDSMGKGINIYPSKYSSWGKSSGFLIAYFQGPFKFIYSFLSSWGHGYSCQTCFGSKFLPHWVFILSPEGFQSHSKLKCSYHLFFCLHLSTNIKKWILQQFQQKKQQWQKIYRIIFSI